LRAMHPRRAAMRMPERYARAKYKATARSRSAFVICGGRPSYRLIDTRIRQTSPG